jgi:Fungalysin metallopeptidase (M36)
MLFLVYNSSIALTAAKNTEYQSFQLPVPTDSNGISLIKYLQSKNLLNAQEGISYRLISYRESPAAVHFLFDIYLEGLPIADHQINLTVDHGGRLRSIGGNINLPTFQRFGVETKSVLLPEYIRQLGILRDIHSAYQVIAQPLWFRSADSLFAGQRFSVYSDDIHQASFAYQIDCINGQVQSVLDLRSFAEAMDTTCVGYAFYPDPITSSQTVYGDPLRDRGDSNSIELDAQRIWVQVPCEKDSNTFYLQNKYVSIRELEPPTTAPTFSLNDSFVFNRSNSGFEDFNVLYHIKQLQEHLHVLGFHLAESPLPIDAHALSGADNSFFTYTPYPQIHYGTGGVDDAEDADVITHEYGHALSFSAAPGTNIGTERSSVDEGFCDYIATSYSRNISAYFWDSMFTWDGHNEFWKGRVANAPFVYPRDRTNSIYHNGEIWSAALTEIWESIGRDKADALAVECMYQQYKNANMRNAAQMYLLSDSLLFEGKNHCIIYQAFMNHGLVDSSEQVYCEGYPFEFGSADSNAILLLNTLAFADGTGPAYLWIPGRLPQVTAELYNIQGQYLDSWSNEKRYISIEIPPYHIPAGTYILRVKNLVRDKTFKLIRVR